MQNVVYACWVTIVTTIHMSHKIALKVTIVISTLSSQHRALKVHISLLRIRVSLTIVCLARADTLALMKVSAV